MSFIAPEYTAKISELLKSSTLFLLERLEKNGSMYPFIDTKFDIVSGKDFGPQSEDFRQKDHIYGWVQGRGLEALAGAAEHFSNVGEEALADRISAALARLVAALEKLRNSTGRLTFCMDLQGNSRFPAVQTQNYTDLFYAKGLLAAGKHLQDAELAATGKELLDQVIESIINGSFQTDQHIFDPANRGGHAVGKFAQGPLMLALGGTALSGDRQTAERLINTILVKHLNAGRFPGLQEYDFIEAVDADGQPWREADGAIVCDPGHALEFIGLACKNLLTSSELPELAAKHFVSLFDRMFAIGFQENSGIMKSYDLSKHSPLDTNSPWWSLPEAIRAGVFLMKLFPDRKEHLSIAVEKMLKNFFTVFATQGTHGFACQTCNKNGKAIQVIPAVPDADPLYHTNLALIDSIKLN